MRIDRNKNRDISYYDDTWPDKMVLFITSHGSFSREEDTTDFTIQKIRVPSGIKVNYLYASAHGSVTAYRENDAKRMFGFIKTHLPVIVGDNLAAKKTVLSQYSEMMMNVKDDIFTNITNDIHRYKQLLQNSMQMYQNQTKKNKKYRAKINELSQTVTPFVKNHTESQKSIDNFYAKGFTYTTYNENEFMPNKQFYRGIRDIFLGNNVGSNKYNFAIRLMNLKNQPDLMDLLQSTRYKKGGIFGVDETPTITTQQMIDMCMQHGVTEITIIDSACGQLDGNDRELRNFRRSMNRDPNGEFLLNSTNYRGTRSQP